VAAAVTLLIVWSSRAGTITVLYLPATGTDAATGITTTNTLRFAFRATTDKGTILADDFTPADSALIPARKIAPAAGTPFDFGKPTPIGASINDNNQQLKYCSVTT